MDNNEQASSDVLGEILAEKTRSLGTAYLLLPVFGAHRLYLGNWLGGLLILFLALVSIGIGPEVFVFFYPAMLVLEALLLPAAVRKKNAVLAAEIATHPERFVIPDEDHIAPWARGKDKRSDLGWRDAAARTLIFFIVLPGLTGYGAAELHSLELLIIPLVLLVAIGLVSSLDHTLTRFPTILEVPGVGPALERVAAMRAHYWEHEPKVLAAYWGLFRHAFTHYKPYWGLASIVLATVVIEGFISWEDNTSYIEYDEAALIVGITALIAAGVTLFNLVPVTALAFRYSLSGKTARLRFMILGALLATYTGHLVSKDQVLTDGEGQAPSFLSAMRLDERMQNPEFQGQLKERLEFFLNYYVGSGNTPNYMREKLGSLLQGIAPNDEIIAFGIINAANWIGVSRYHTLGECSLNPYTGKLQEGSLPVIALDEKGDQFLDEDGNVVEEYAKRFSLLALVYKPSTNEKYDLLMTMQNAASEPDKIIKELDKKITFYNWGEMPEQRKEFFSMDNVVGKACQRLLCEEEGNCAPDQLQPDLASSS